MEKSNKSPIDIPPTSDQDSKDGKPTALHIGFWKGNKKAKWALFPKQFQNEKQARDTIARTVTAEAVKVVKVDLS